MITVSVMKGLTNSPKQLNVMTTNVDVFAADLLHHQSCYNRFVYSFEGKSTSAEMTEKEISALSAEKEFIILIKRKILIQNN